MLGSKHAYPSKERLLVDNFALGAKIRETFRRIDSQRGELYGYLTAVQIIATGTLDESEPGSAPLPRMILWNLINLSLKGNGHTWLQNCPGAVMIAQNHMDQLLAPSNADGIVTSDYVPGAGPQDFRMEWLIPITPKFFRNENTKGVKDGIWPLCAMRDHGELQIDVRPDLPDFWVFNDDGIDFIVIIHTYYTEDPIFSNPWRIQTSSSADSRYVAPSFEGKCDSAFVVDEEFLDLVLPVANPRLTVDGLPIQEGITGMELHAAQDASRTIGLGLYWPEGILPLICPSEAKGFADFPYGSRFVFEDCNLSQPDKMVRYVIRRSMDLGVEGTAVLAALMGVEINPAKESERLEIGGSRTKPGALGMPRARIMGMNVRVKQ